MCNIVAKKETIIGTVKKNILNNISKEKAQAIRTLLK